MEHSLEALLILQEKDRKRVRLQREIRDIPARKADIEKQIKGARENHQSAQEELKKINVDLNQLEVEVESRREKITKYKNQQMEAKTNEQYRALLSEAAAEEKEISALEDKEIILMETVESVKKRIAECESSLKTEQEGISEELQMLDERMKEAKEDLEALSEERQKAAQEVKPALLARYERLFANKGDFAVVEVENAHCAGCRMKLPPQVVNDALNPKKLVSCNFCGRMLINRR